MYIKSCLTVAKFFAYICTEHLIKQSII